MYDGDLMDSDGEFYVPDWAADAFLGGVLYYGSHPDVSPMELFVRTLEGDMHVSVGDYIIQGVSGELYPCKPDIFEKSYDEVVQ